MINRLKSWLFKQLLLDLLACDDRQVSDCTADYICRLDDCVQERNQR